jgi:chemotaxis signal transduction protein
MAGSCPCGDLRRRLGLREREVAFDDRILIVRTEAGLLGVAVEEVKLCMEPRSNKR